ncbi:MAG: hypothetical protein EAZ89_09770 [Bacteroidetes bacterium]|nr:MAG: hypothetical protein EAZ89_09770 [Bacteroidota bacterium]
MQAGHYYHVYNRGINGGNIFFEARNYPFFLQKYAYYLSPVVDTYAYCLLGNHFHLLIRVKEEWTLPHRSDFAEKGLHDVNNVVSKRFSDFFNAYVKSINKAYNRTGGLLDTPFRRLRVDHPAYFQRLIHYIHANPQKHGFVEDYRDYPYSSYYSHLSNQPTRLAREAVLGWFGSAGAYRDFHAGSPDESGIGGVIIEV